MGLPITSYVIQGLAGKEGVKDMRSANFSDKKLRCDLAVRANSRGPTAPSVLPQKQANAS
jgi:hypothetical protein